MTELLILAVYLPGTKMPVLGGFVLMEEDSTDWTVVFHRHWERLSPKEAEVLDSMEEALQALVQECKTSGRDFVDLVDSQFSNTIRCMERLKLPKKMPLRQCRDLLTKALFL
jgi:hypothetical protein